MSNNYQFWSLKLTNVSVRPVRDKFLGMSIFKPYKSINRCIMILPRVDMELYEVSPVRGKIGVQFVYNNSEGQIITSLIMNA